MSRMALLTYLGVSRNLFNAARDSIIQSFFLFGYYYDILKDLSFNSLWESMSNIKGHNIVDKKIFLGNWPVACYFS